MHKLANMPQAKRINCTQIQIYVCMYVYIQVYIYLCTYFMPLNAVASLSRKQLSAHTPLTVIILAHLSTRTYTYTFAHSCNLIDMFQIKI